MVFVGWILIVPKNLIYFLFELLLIDICISIPLKQSVLIFCL